MNKKLEAIKNFKPTRQPRVKAKQELPSMTPINHQNAELDKIRAFMVECAAIYTQIYDGQIRDWAAKYAIYLRDAIGHDVAGLVSPKPPLLSMEKDEITLKAKRDLQAVADKFFGL